MVVKQSRGSSATAIAVCGIHEMLKYLPEVDEDKDIYKHTMHAMLRSLIEIMLVISTSLEERRFFMECTHGILARGR